MTIGEIQDTLEFYNKREEVLLNVNMQRSAFIAYYGGAYSRQGVKLPSTIQKAFPSLFGRTDDGQIKAENWQESERALRQIAARFNSRSVKH
jgi:hypothetical protein